MISNTMTKNIEVTNLLDLISLEVVIYSDSSTYKIVEVIQYNDQPISSKGLEENQPLIPRGGTIVHKRTSFMIFFDFFTGSVDSKNHIHRKEEYTDL